MSAECDIAELCRAMKRHGLSKEECAGLFVEIIDALEWGLFDVDYNSDGWLKKEEKAAMKWVYPEG